MMEIWLSILATGIITALAIYATSRQIRVGVREAITAIHEDIKHSQEKLEKTVQKVKE